MFNAVLIKTFGFLIAQCIHVKIVCIMETIDYNITNIWREISCNMAASKFISSIHIFSCI